MVCSVVNPKPPYPCIIHCGSFLRVGFKCLKQECNIPSHNLIWIVESEVRPRCCSYDCRRSKAEGQEGGVGKFFEQPQQHKADGREKLTVTIPRRVRELSCLQHSARSCPMPARLRHVGNPLFEMDNRKYSARNVSLRCTPYW